MSSKRILFLLILNSSLFTLCLLSNTKPILTVGTVWK